MPEHSIKITHLRRCLGVACLHVGRTDEPVVVTRHGKAEVAIVPLWEWRFFKELEADLRAGRHRLIEVWGECAELNES